MMWLSWRQFRTQALIAAGGLVALAAFLAATGPKLAHAYSSGMAGCTSQGDCSLFVRRFFQDHQTAFVLISMVVLFLPALIGLFWGAPLVAREIEAGTHRLAWNQTVTRNRWLAVKLGVGALATAAVTGLASLAVFWWASPLDKVAGEQLPRIAPPIFDTRGVAPIGYALFAFALGVAAGMITRRTLPAMAAVLVVFIAVQVAVPMLIRPHLIPPVRTTEAITSSNIDGFTISDGIAQVQVKTSDPNAWLLTNQTIDANGNKVAGLPDAVSALCIPAPPGGVLKAPAKAPGFKQACFNAIAQQGYRQEVVYQPASRFWQLQWMETGLFAVLALGIAAFSFRRIRQLS